MLLSGNLENRKGSSMFLCESLKTLKVFQCSGAETFKNLRLFNVFVRKASKPTVFQRFGANAFNNLRCFCILGWKPSSLGDKL